MINTFPSQLKIITAGAQERRASTGWWLWYTCLLCITGYVGMSLVLYGPNPSMIGWFCYISGIAAILYQPRYGVYLIVGLALIGDSALLPWYPFVKNFSSSESLLFLNDAAVISPIETYIGLTLLSWLGRGVIQRKLDGWYTGPLFWPAIVFIAFITFGLLYGLSRGGALNIALWEVRAIYYLPTMLILTSNLIETRTHANQLIWMAMIGIFLKGLAGVWFVATVLNFNISSVERIAEHSASIHWSTLFVLVIAAWMFRASYAKRLLLPVMLPWVMLSFFANQRRASFITLAIALVLIAVVLYRENRKAFWLLVPVVSIVGLIYLGAFWNGHGTLAQPARAIRSVVAPDAGSERDAASNQYRVFENINTMFTIKNAPFTGVGFGNKFYIIINMADISVFEWWEYITHNSIFWIWMKAGIGGFLSMIFLVGLSVIVGVRGLLRMPGRDMSAIALTATLYIVMHFIFAYVDMSWGGLNMVYVGAMMGLVNSMEQIVARCVPAPAIRWPWQPNPVSAPGLRSV